MTGEIELNSRLLIADADRERAVTRLHKAVGEGRLTLSEFEDRMSGVLASRTFADVQPFLADLPEPAELAQPLELSARGSSIVRTGRWAVPARMQLKATGSSIVLNFIEAQLSSDVVYIDVELRGSSFRMTVPEGSSVDAGAVFMAGSSVRVRHVSGQPAAGATHYVVTGTLKGSTIKARPPMRWFWRRRAR
jgi:hypothetical protein